VRGRYLGIELVHLGKSGVMTFEKQGGIRRKGLEITRRQQEGSICLVMCTDKRELRSILGRERKKVRARPRE